MRRGKYTKKRRCNFHKGKILLVALVLILDIAAGSTTAFLVSKSGPAENTFVHAYVACEVQEDAFTNGTNTNKTNVKVKNTGNTESYIRAAIIVTWKNKDGNVYPKTPKVGVDYIMELPTSKWFKAQDGFYYYKYPVAPEKLTEENLINRCYPVYPLAAELEGYGLSVEILASAIQSQPAKAVQESWGVTVNDDGSISKA